MNGKAVCHAIYGHGEVSGRSGKTIRIRFEREGVGEKSFVYPDAFSTYLRFEEEDLQAEIENKLAESQKILQEETARRIAERKAAMEEERRHQRELAAARKKSAPCKKRKKADETAAEEQ